MYWFKMTITVQLHTYIYTIYIHTTKTILIIYHMFYCKIASNVDDNKQERGQCHKYMQIDLIEQRRKKYISKRADHLQSTLVHPQPCAIVQRAVRICHLYLTEKMLISPPDPRTTLNKKNEIVTTGTRCFLKTGNFFPLLAQDPPPPLYDHH